MTLSRLREFVAPPSEMAAVPQAPEWTEYFRRLVVERAPRGGRREFLADDIAAALASSIHKNARVLEVGVGRGEILARLPNAVRHGVDTLPEAVRVARERDSRMRIDLADAMTMDLGETYDAIIVDRLV